MRHRRIPVIPGQPSPALTPYRHQPSGLIGKVGDGRSTTTPTTCRRSSCATTATRLAERGLDTSADGRSPVRRPHLAGRPGDRRAARRATPRSSSPGQPEGETVLTGTRAAARCGTRRAGQRCLRPTTPTRKRSKWRTTPAATYPVISFGAFEAGDERRYRGSTLRQLRLIRDGTAVRGRSVLRCSGRANHHDPVTRPHLPDSKPGSGSPPRQEQRDGMGEPARGCVAHSNRREILP